MLAPASELTITPARTVRSELKPSSIYLHYVSDLDLYEYISHYDTNHDAQSGPPMGPCRLTITFQY